jgi:hypothetical protein
MNDVTNNQTQPDPTAYRWIILIGLALVAYVGGIFFYLKGLGAPGYAAVEATRAVLVFTIIVAMLGFGGVLIIRPLFSDEDPAKLQERFRLAREVFMVFAGVFGTMIGFYFGAGGLAPADPPSLGTPAFADRKVTVEVRGGRRPLRAEIILPPVPPSTSGSRQGMAVADGILSYAIPSGVCPAGARIEVTDSDNRIANAQVSCPPAGTTGAAPPAATNTTAAQNVTGNGL